jgi:hypothetical protein
MKSGPSRTKRHLLRVEVLLFLSLWFFYGCLINSGNLNAFGLQQAVVDAYVSRHHLYLEGATDPRFRVEPAGDAFLFNGHIYPAKQPAGFLMGALVYFPVRALGLNYSSNYLLVAALVTFFTASLVAAISAAFVFQTARWLIGTPNFGWPMIAALAYAIGTTMLAYSGVPWHDTIATGYLVIALYFLVRLRFAARSPHEKLFSLASGLFLGLTITSSMLPLLMVVVAAGYFLSLRRWELVIHFIAGCALGLAPLLIYNSICFGNPVLVPNIAGNYSDTFFRPSFANFANKAKFYARMLTLYVPMFWLGLAGLCLYGPRLRREQVILSLMIVGLIAYLLNIEADGTCQYGPRYLLPAMPLVSLGLLGFKSIEKGGVRLFAILLLALVVVASAGINLIGAMHGAMLCYFPHFAATRYLSEMVQGQLREFPLAKWLVGPMILSAAALALTYVLKSREPLIGSNLQHSRANGPIIK